MQSDKYNYYGSIFLKILNHVTMKLKNKPLPGSIPLEKLKSSASPLNTRATFKEISTCEIVIITLNRDLF